MLYVLPNFFGNILHLTVNFLIKINDKIEK